MNSCDKMVEMIKKFNWKMLSTLGLSEALYGRCRQR